MRRTSDGRLQDEPEDSDDLDEMANWARVYRELIERIPPLDEPGPVLTEQIERLTARAEFWIRRWRQVAGDWPPANVGQ